MKKLHRLHHQPSIQADMVPTPTHKEKRPSETTQTKIENKTPNETMQYSTKTFCAESSEIIKCKNSLQT
jgi:hypothetical protein